MILISGHRIDLVLILAMAMIFISFSYLTLLAILAKINPPKWVPRDYASESGEAPAVIFVMPCLNEGLVIGASLRRLLSLDYPNFHIVVIDDGSDDDTADVVRTFDDPRLILFQRKLPNARQGKGHALNAAFKFILGGGVLPNLDPENTVLAVVDADGHMDPESLNYVIPAFEDTTLAGAQIGVRINNRTSNLLARMQDFEFVVYTELFQRGRVKLKSVGLGGNGQFVRVSAMQSLGPSPWSSSLTEDLDLGVRLTLAGYRIDYCPNVAVHQQGLESTGRWLRQRARWFQGFLQGWGQLADILTRLRGSRRVDLFYLLTSPVLILITTFLTLSFLTWMIGFAVNLVAGTAQPSWLLLWTYVLAFGPGILLSLAYRGHEPGLGYIKAIAFGHLYVVYSLLWVLAGWRAVWNQIRGKTGWAKTERVREEPGEVAENEALASSAAKEAHAVESEK